MYGNELFSDETWHPVYLELGINFKILFQSQTILGLVLGLRLTMLCLRSSILLPGCQAVKRVLNYMTGLESHLHYGVLDQETSEEKFTYGMAAVFEKC